VALSGVKRLEIETGQGSVLQIERSYVDPRIADQHATDFATFRPVVEAGAILPAGLALATAAQEGQKIFAFGRPLHEHQPVVGNEGSVSAPPPSSDGMGKRSLTHTAKVNHGMSGGPIVDERGDVIGIVAGGDSDPGIGYVTNDVYVDEFRTLVEHGQVFEEIQVSMKIIDLMADARKLTGA
jgi:S1-C subfamily serine protease